MQVTKQYVSILRTELFLLTYSVQMHNETSRGDGKPDQRLAAFLMSLPASQ